MEERAVTTASLLVLSGQADKEMTDVCRFNYLPLPFPLRVGLGPSAGEQSATILRTMSPTPDITYLNVHSRYTWLTNY